MDWSTLFPFLSGGAPVDPYAGGSYAPAPLPALPGTAGGIGSDYAANPFAGAALGGAAYQAPAVATGSAGGNVANAPGGGIGSDYAASGGQGPGAAPYTSPAASSANAALGKLPGSLQDALRGVQAIQRPPVQTVKTPAAPPRKQMDVNAAVNLLTSLGIGPAQAAGIGLLRR